jgi:hypothetical protein
LFRTFDFPSPDVSNPQRFVTTVPQQALFMINSPFVVEQARAITTKPEFEKVESASEWQIQDLYERVYARRAEQSEVDAALKFVTDEAKRPLKAARKRRRGATAMAPSTLLSAKRTSPDCRSSPKTPGRAVTNCPTTTRLGHAQSRGRPCRQRCGTRRGSSLDGTARPDYFHQRKAVAPRRSRDGVEGIIVSSRGGELLRVTAEAKGNADTNLEKIEVKAGERSTSSPASALTITPTASCGP